MAEYKDDFKTIFKNSFLCCLVEILQMCIAAATNTVQAMNEISIRSTTYPPSL